jgi:protein-tyrosine phosphatase
MNTINYIPGTNLFISDQFAASNPNLLVKNNIKCILNVTPVNTPNYTGIEYYQVQMQDSAEQDLLGNLPECFSFLDYAYTKRHNVLIHCQAGISRSASVLIAYLMTKMNISYITAYKMVKQARPMIEPNKNFEKQLKTLGDGSC